VTRVEVSYQDGPLDPGGPTALMAVEMRHGAPYTAVVGNATRLVWQSRLNPLSTIIIGVADQQDHHLVWDDTLDADGADKAMLEHAYGSR
jgi:hypothetical protein